MMISLLFALLFVISESSSAASSSASSSSSLAVDVLIYGGNAAGIAAGIAAANGVGSRHVVHIFEPLGMLGGMAVAGGVGLMNNQDGVYGQGIGGRWCALNGAAYNSKSPNCFPEMKVGQKSFETMIDATSNLTLSLGCHMISVTTNSACLSSVTFMCANGTVTVSAAVFIDASYDGDIMVAAGVSHTSGREASSEYNESLAGVNLLNETNENFEHLDIDPYWPDGTLLKGISNEALPPVGTADDRLMAFSFFFCASPLADGNAIPWPMPTGYNASDFELLRRVIEKYKEQGHVFELSDFSESATYSTPANITKLLLCCGRAPVNMDQPDLNRGWATATYEERRVMEEAHRYYLLGSLYFMSNDPRVSNFTRYAIGRWGLCADEYVGFDNLPPQIYVRISNRMQSDTFLTQNTLWNPQTRADGIAVGHWEYDQHTESRRAIIDPLNATRSIVINEGYFRAGGSNWYDLPFSVMCPKRGEVNNLLVPVAISVSSVAYASARIEQMYLDAGAAAGVAAALALEGNGGGGGGQRADVVCPALAIMMQDTNVTAVQNALVHLYGQRIHGPP